MDEAIFLEARREDAELLQTWIEEHLETADGPERWMLIRIVEHLARTLDRTSV